MGACIFMEVYQMFSTTKQVFERMLRMNELSWRLWMRSLILSCVMLFCAFILLIDGTPFTARTYDTYLTAHTLFTLPQLVLLFGILGSVCIEDYLA